MSDEKKILELKNSLLKNKAIRDVSVIVDSLAVNTAEIIPLPELTNGPHLSYAIQWILFALLLPIGWYVLLKNESK